MIRPADIRHLARHNAWTRRHPAEKAAVALTVVVAAQASASPAVIAATGASALALLLAGARVPAASALPVIALPLGFAAAGAALLPVSIAAGVPAFDTTQVPIALRAVLRVFACTSGVLLVALTTDVDDLLHALRRVGLLEELVTLSAAMHRFAFVLFDRVLVMGQAQDARLGYASASSGRRAAGLLAVNLFGQSMAMAARLERGLEARGFDGRVPLARRYAPVQPVRTLLSMGVVLLPAVVAAIW